MSDYMTISLCSTGTYLRVWIPSPLLPGYLRDLLLTLNFDSLFEVDAKLTLCIARNVDVSYIVRSRGGALFLVGS